LSPYLAIEELVHSFRHRLSFLRRLVPERLRRRLLSPIARRAIERLASRAFLRDAILPALVEAGCRRLLVVGTRPYNLAFYRDCEARGLAAWSVDLDPAAAKWAAPQGHFAGDVRRIDSLAAGQTFDAVLLNGMLGFGIDNAEDAAQTLAALIAVAEPGALLIVGWNPGLTGDGEIEVFRNRLAAQPLGALDQYREFPPQGRVLPNPHRYEFFRLRAG
jgi:hypothetical protein